MRTQTSLAKIFAISLILAGFTAETAHAQNLGDSCNPDISLGHTARIGSFSGSVTLVDAGNHSLSVQNGTAIPSGALLQTGSNGQVELIIEDGTDMRSSRMSVAAGTSLYVNGGLYCDDLRPIRDDGRWTVRELAFELTEGSVRFELAEEVPTRIDVSFKSQNALAEMRRNRQEPVVVEVSADGLDDRSLVHVTEHPEISRHMTGMLFGRSIDDLSATDQRRMQQQAVITAISMGYYELEEEVIAANSQAQSVIAMMGGGRPFSELDASQKEMVAQLVGTMLIESGELDPAEVYVYDHPDESTVITVHTGQFLVRNTYIGFNRDKMVSPEAGMTVYVNGYSEPVLN